MRKLILSIAAAGAALATAAPAMAQTYDYGRGGYGYGQGYGDRGGYRGDNPRLQRVAWELQRAEQRGALSQRDAWQFRRELRDLYQLDARLRYDGRSRWDYQQVDRRADWLERRIEDAARNGRWGNDGRDGRWGHHDHDDDDHDGGYRRW